MSFFFLNVNLLKDHQTLEQFKCALVICLVYIRSPHPRSLQSQFWVLSIHFQAAKIVPLDHNTSLQFNDRSHSTKQRSHIHLKFSTINCIFLRMIDQGQVFSISPNFSRLHEVQSVKRFQSYFIITFQFQQMSTICQQS